MQTKLCKKNTIARPPVQTQPCIEETVQRQMPAADHLKPDQPKFFRPENRTGMPDHLKSRMEQMSGYSMDDVRVHYNSDKPAQLQAPAYTQGADIHIAPGQEKHLPHEAWHVIQQKQGRVMPAMQYKGTGINDDAALEHEADVMGEQALTCCPPAGIVQQKPVSGTCIQRKVTAKLRSTLSGRSVIGQSSGKNTLAEVKDDPAKTVVEKFCENIIPKKINSDDTEPRPIYQCAEPHALAEFLKKYNDDLNWSLLNSLKFDFVINEASGIEPYNMSPCAVCEQWVENKHGIDEKVNIANIIKENEFKEESNNEINKRIQREREQQEKEQHKKQQKDEGMLLHSICQCLNDLLLEEDPNVAEYLKIAYGVSELEFISGMWCPPGEEDNSELLSMKPMDIKDHILSSSMTLDGYYEKCREFQAALQEVE